MKLITWNNSFSVYVKSIDDQHRRLIKIINCAQRAHNLNKDRRLLTTIMNSLIRYSETHFATEEKLMEDFGYPEYKEHKREHESLLLDIFEINSLYNKKDIGADILLNFLKDWLICHILDTDKRCGLFLKNKGLS
ncbi:bacteriohemerythrin [Thermosulfuriphilus sp.]